MTHYTYSITNFHGHKLIGGTMSAESMEDAVVKIAQINELAIRHNGTTVRPCDLALIKDCDWIRFGAKVYLSIYVPPEVFMDRVK